MTTILLSNIQAIFIAILEISIRSEHERGANEFSIILEFEGENCYIPSSKACFLKCIIYIFKKDFSTEYFEFIQSYKRRTNVMTRCRIPEFYGRYKMESGKYDVNSKKTLPRSVEQRDVRVYIHKNHYCVIWQKNRKDALLNGVERIERNFRYVKNEINKKII